MPRKTKDQIITEESGKETVLYENSEIASIEPESTFMPSMDEPSRLENTASEEGEASALEDTPTTAEESNQPLTDTEKATDIAAQAILETLPEKPPTRRKKSKPISEDKPLTAKQAFYQTDFRELDRNLSPEQEQEWNSIYASFRSGSILTGTVIGVDEYTLNISVGGGEMERRTVQSLVVIDYRVKVIIPETEVWAIGEEKPDYVTRSMVGAKIDYVIMNVDRPGDCAIASRKMALTKRRRHVMATKDRLEGSLVKCEVLLVGAKRLLAGYGGFDVPMTQQHLSYTAIADLRTEYKPGQELTARLLDMKDGKPNLSVKEVNPNPFDGAELRHPIGSRRQAVIEGKYAGGIFCCLPDDTTCLCLYSNEHFDTEFDEGDTVLIHITRYDYHKKLIYGRIVAKR